MKKANLVLSKEHSGKILKSLEPEAEEGMKRVLTDISFDPPEIEIKAEDSGSLRAAMNSYLRWLKISEEITEKYG